MRSFLFTLVILGLLAGALYLYWWNQPDAVAPQTPSTAERTEATDAKPSLPVSDRPAEDPLEREAREYIRDLTALQDKPLAADNADNFVQRDQNIRLLPTQKAEEVTPRQLLTDPGLKPDTPLTVIKEVDQIEIVTAGKLRESGAGEPGRPIRVIEGDTVKDTTVAEVLEQHADAPDAPITIVKKVEEVNLMTPQEIGQDTSLEADKPLRIMRGRQSLDEATVAELMMGSGQDNADTLYYVRTVKDTDIQGIWGIIQYGLIDNFARGMAIRRGEDINTYRVDIPQGADEMENRNTSSFLGRMIYEKSQNSYIYNLQQGRMGHNPDMIRPGQELLIVRFTPEELVAIYKHFVASKNT